MSRLAAPHELMPMKIIQMDKITAIPGLDVVTRENFSCKNL
jgi:hypothetical protein